MDHPSSSNQDEGKVNMQRVYSRDAALLLRLKSIIVRFMKYRKTHTDARKFISPIVKGMHKTLCESTKCRCGHISSALFHVDSCCNQECSFCKSLWRSFQVSGQKADYLKRSHGSDTNNFPNKRVKAVSSETHFWLSDLIDEIKYLSDYDMGSAKEEKVDPNIGGSILEFFTTDELQEHLSSLRLSSNQDVEGSKTMSTSGENSCNLCGMEVLMFAPRPKYCSSCCGRIKKSSNYFILDDVAAKSCVCATCFKVFRRNIPIAGKSITKSMLRMERNNPEDEEPWVQCDKCGGWQHQICGLYNDKNDLGEKAEYTCPKCYLLQIKAGEHVPIQNTPTFGAKNLPTTKLSDYIERRLFRRLKQERKERAKASGKGFNEVPGATDLFIRVVVSSNKILKVNEQFLQIFGDEKHPSEFPYRAKVILLFQKIGGNDVCLFVICAQEYGSECNYPNQRSIYISHLDSVKYFKPEIKSAYSESLRTFVYHEILIGYLDYCKKRGFSTAYIWSCPPMKGDDYIFYCHPETQKTPTPDQLRHWYKSMLKKAAKENIVINSTNFYDHYFVPDEERNIKVSAASLPYFEGAYWCGAAIDIIKDIEKEIELKSKKKVEKAISRRTLKALGLKDLSGDATKDILLMEKMGEKILPMKEDFFMVHLRAPDDVSACTDDPDAILETIQFESRNNFLSFCQGTQLRGSSETNFPYQFDSLRCAKYSSMMILYYLNSRRKNWKMEND